ncbi:MAG: glycosyltransferase [Chlamydiae bacterium]|nr:glycosyltransferase [Chlamydiota bacterium]
MNHYIHISVVSPAYKCAGCIEELYKRLVPVLSKISSDYEIIFVDDDSPDNDWDVISSLCAKDSKVRGIKLIRNYGQHYAITAGLDASKGEWVIVMDCDLQDQPEGIRDLYSKAVEGNELVFARRVSRKDPLHRKIVSNLFTLLYNWLGDMDFDNSIANFSICSRRVIQSVCQFRERNRSFPKILFEIGFKHSIIDIPRACRFQGKSSYNFSKLFDLALQCILAHSNKPLRLSIRFGFTLSFLSLFFGLVVLFRYCYSEVGVPGWTTLALLISFLGGLGFANLGILGLYLGRVFDEVKNRPLYFVQKSLNDPTEGSKIGNITQPRA